jgi:hypothetical protein
VAQNDDELSAQVLDRILDAGKGVIERTLPATRISLVASDVRIAVVRLFSGLTRPATAGKL